jgi:hypothetical protein
LYLIRNESLAAIKIGVTTDAARRSRLEVHARNGWELIDTRRTSTGAAAEILESAVLAWWRNDLHMPIATAHAEMPQGGYTETAPLGMVNVPLLWQRIDSLLNELERIS